MAKIFLIIYSISRFARKDNIYFKHFARKDKLFTNFFARKDIF